MKYNCDIISTEKNNAHVICIISFQLYGAAKKY